MCIQYHDLPIPFTLICAGVNVWKCISQLQIRYTVYYRDEPMQANPPNNITHTVTHVNFEGQVATGIDPSGIDITF